MTIAKSELCASLHKVAKDVEKISDKNVRSDDRVVDIASMEN